MDDFVFEGGNREWAFATIFLRNVAPTGWLRPIRSGFDPGVRQATAGRRCAPRRRCDLCIRHQDRSGGRVHARPFRPVVVREDSRRSEAGAKSCRLHPRSTYAGRRISIMTVGTGAAAGRFRAWAITAFTSSIRPTTSRPGFPSSADRTPRRCARLAHSWNWSSQPGSKSGKAPTASPI